MPAQWCWGKEPGAALVRLDLHGPHVRPNLLAIPCRRWGHVVPARQARERHGAGAEDLPPLELLHQFRPAEASPATERLRQRSKEIAQAAQATFFPSRQRGA